MKKMFLFIITLFVGIITYSQIQVEVKVYKDKDADNYVRGDGRNVFKPSKPYNNLIAMGYREIIPSGKDGKNQFIDCEDHVEGYIPTKIYYDGDGDGFLLNINKTGIWKCLKSDDFGKLILPPHYTNDPKNLNGQEDCDDGDNQAWKFVDFYWDTDQDGYLDGFTDKKCWNDKPEIPWPDGAYKRLIDAKGNDQKNNFIDCDDHPEGYIAKEVGIDNDGDGCKDGTEWICVKEGDPLPPKRVEKTAQNDRDDNDPKVCQKDTDGDGVFDDADCSPNDPTKWRMACVQPIPKPWEDNSTACVGNTPPPGTRFCGGGGSSIEYSIYPNPVSDKLNITPDANWNERAEIKLIDQYARVVRTLQVPNAVKGQTFTINTADLKPGLYQLTIRRGEMIESKTIAVKL